MTQSQDDKHSNVLSFQRGISIEFIRNSGGFAVRVNKNDKSPAKGWSPRNNSKAKSDEVLDSLSPEDNLGIHLHGSLVDVDVDSDSPWLMLALDRLLPPCSHVWGRESRPRTHRAYMIKDNSEGFDPSSHPLLTRLKRIPEAKIELRGGPITRGEFCLLPGSVHPSGEKYLWADTAKARSSLSAVTEFTLLRAIRLASAVAVLAPYWQEGLRNDLCMALSGFLFRAHSITESLDDSLFTLDRDQSRQFLQTLMEIVGDDTADVGARLKTFDRTWAKAENDAPTTGATTIGKLTGDDSVVSKLYTLLTDSPDVAAIEEFTARFAIWQGPGRVIDIERATLGDMRPHMSRAEFTNSYGYQFVTYNDKNKQLTEMLFQMKSATRVAGLTFRPGHPTMVAEYGGTYINQWGGFEIPPHDEPVTYDDVALALDYLWEVVARENQVRYDWVLAWLADIFQGPDEKCGTALVLVGKQGAGKSILGHSLIAPIIGARHAATTNNVESVTKDFNIAFDNKLFIQCDEATNNRQRTTTARLKSLITDPMKLVEPKGVDAYQKPNLARFLLTSNDSSDAIYLGEGRDDRRYTILDVSPHRADDPDYWDRLVTWAEDQHNLSKLHRYLLDHEYSRRLVMRPLNTDTKATMQQHSWPAFDSWLASWVARGHPLAEYTHMQWYDAPIGRSKEIERTGWPEGVTTEALLRDYQHHCRTQNHRGAPALNEQQVVSELRARNLWPDGKATFRRVKRYDEKKQQTVSTRVRIYPTPDKRDVAAYLEDRYGFVVDSDEDGDEVSDHPEATEF